MLGEFRAVERAAADGGLSFADAMRLLVHTGAFNLGLLMRTLIGVGTPRGLQGRLAAVLTLVVALWTRFGDFSRDRGTPSADHASAFTPHHRCQLLPVRASEWAV